MSYALHEVENLDREVQRSMKDIEDQLGRAEQGMGSPTVSLDFPPNTHVHCTL